MNLRLGYAVSSKSKSTKDLINKLKYILKYQDDVIELSLTRESKMQHSYNSKLIKLINKFSYRSIHAPVLDINLEKVKYPSKRGKILLDRIDEIVKKVNPEVLLFHPDTVTDFTWLYKRYGNLIAFENMDKEKDFGKTVKDLEIVFKKCPKAKWVFDLNHIYTNDKSMRSTGKFYTSFSNRLCHYHLSSFGGFHDCFCHTHEDIIFEGLTDFSKPVVHEGGVIEKELIKEESEYIKKYLVENSR